MKQVSFDDIEKTGSNLSSAPPLEVAGPTPKSIWGKAEALQRLGGDEKLLRELCQIFVDESPKTLQKLREAIAISDPEAVMRAAHGLKGELGYLGASKAVQVAQELENMGHDKDLVRAAEAFSVLDKEFASLHIVLIESVGEIS